MKPTVSQVVDYLKSQGYIPTIGQIKPRPSVTYRGYKRNMAKTLRKLVK